jgi:predicted membrane metal-binding protein
LYAKDREPGPAARLVIETLSAEIMTLPILIVSFGYVPVLALLANVFVAPVIPAAMFFTFIAGVVGWIVPWLTFLAYPATILIAYVVAIVEKLANVEWARIPVTVTALFAVIWYVVLAGVSWSVWRRRKVDLLAQSVVE